MQDSPQNTPQNDHKEEEKELQAIFPLFKNWRSLYWFVLGELLVLILFFYLFSRYFS